MDLKLEAPPPTDEERAAVDDVLGTPPSGWEGGTPTARDQRVAVGGHAARGRRHLLLPALHAIRDRVGYISHGAMDYLCQRLTIPPAEAYGVASGYALLALEPRAPRVVHVCDDIACLQAGASAVTAEMTRRFGPEGSTTGKATWQRSPCLGLCDRAPAAFVQQAGGLTEQREAAFGHASVHLVNQAMAGRWPEHHADPIPQAGDAGLRLLRRVGEVHPESLDDYRASGGYGALRRAFELGPAGVIREITESKLLGRGGAAFPTGRKWDAVARAPQRPHHLVCNADESEPGTFKDRVLMEQDPFAIIEAMTIAAFATGCERGYLYIRGEYPLARHRMQHAIALAHERGFLGTGIMGHDFSFAIEIRRGAGAYICGEETALFNSIEGMRAEPRNKPPFPVDVGLFGKPTVVNNVETLLNVPDIVVGGAAAYATLGTDASTGTRLFCLSGAVARPGLYEITFGMTLRQLLELAGGIRGRMQAILLGGAAGSFVNADALDMPLTFEATRAAGVTLGSGVVMVFDDAVDMHAVVMRIARFFRDESCGQCVPCRVGTVRQEELLTRINAGRPHGSAEEEVVLLRDIGRVLRDASICGLGQTASAASESAARLGLLSAGRRS